MINKRTKGRRGWIKKGGRGDQQKNERRERVDQERGGGGGGDQQKNESRERVDEEKTEARSGGGGGGWGVIKKRTKGGRG